MIIRLKLILIITFFFATLSFAQTIVYNTFSLNIEQITLLRIYPIGANISLNLIADNAGDAIVPIFNNSTYLQLTSIFTSGQTRRITVEISGSTDVPYGTLLKLSAAPCTTGQGVFGTVSTIPFLKYKIGQPLITGIGSGYTNTTSIPNSGYQLTYTFEHDPTKFYYSHPQRIITVTYTITN